MTKDELVQGLNEDLAAEYAALIRHITYAARITGPYRPQLAHLFPAEGAVSGYLQRAKDAEGFGDKRLAVQLEDMVRDESGHAEKSERILRDWPEQEERRC